MDTKTDTTPPILCVRCKGAGANVYGGGVWSHHFWRDCIEHLTARAEAAKVERNIAALRAFNAEAENQRLAAENRRLAARVAELEATLASDAADENQWLDAYIDAAARDGETIKKLMARVAELEAEAAAQGWRPGSETPNAIDTYLVYRAAPPQNEPWRYDFAVWEDDGWDTEGFTHYRPLPPAPNVQEPTP